MNQSESRNKSQDTRTKKKRIYSFQYEIRMIHEFPLRYSALVVGKSSKYQIIRSLKMKYSRNTIEINRA